MPPKKDLLAMWAHFQNPVFMKEIGSELFPLIKWGVDHLLLEEFEILFGQEINKMVSSHNFQNREIKIIEDEIRYFFNSLKLNHINSYPRIRKSEDDIYLILCKYPNFPRKIKEIIHWKVKDDVVVSNWLDLKRLFHAIKGGSEPSKKFNKIGKVKCFKPAYEKIPDVWKLYKKDIQQTEIGRRVFPNLEKKISSVRVHQLIDAAYKIIYGKERPSGKKEHRRLLSKKYSPKELKKHLQNCEDCKNNLGKKRISKPNCEWYKYIYAYVNRDTAYLREKILYGSVESDKKY